VDHFTGSGHVDCRFLARQDYSALRRALEMLRDNAFEVVVDPGCEKPG
jgi:hypothetical protein